MDFAANVGPHFRWSETVTADPNKPQVLEARRRAMAADPAAQRAMAAVIEVAEWVRDLVGGRPVRLTSGYRGPVASGSQHDTGHALDLQVDGFTVLDLLTLVYEHRAESPVPLRQVIGESLHTDPATLRARIARGCGTWLHVAIATDQWARPASKPWATSCAPRSGDRQYVAWRPA
jgi:hypothetical protein